MATMAQKRRKQLVREVRPLIKEWLKKKKATPADGVLQDSEGECYVWHVPNLTYGKHPFSITEKGKLCVRMHVTRYTLFKGRKKSSGIEPVVYDLTDEDVSFDTIEKLIIALSYDLATA